MAARERDEDARAAWWSAVSQVPAERVGVLDETSTNTAMLTRYGWAPRGQRAAAYAPRNHGPNISLVAALSVRGAGPALAVHGPVTTEVFLAYLEQVLVPWLVPGQLVILDNLSVHTDARVRQLLEAAGCELCYLPAYSPDFSPIEAAFAKLKTWLRRVGARTYDDLVTAIGEGLARITPRDAAGCFHGCGYRVDGQLL